LPIIIASILNFSKPKLSSPYFGDQLKPTHPLLTDDDDDVNHLSKWYMLLPLCYKDFA
jgi:hypothetical protein